jgi:O-Antigen ligase
MFALPGILLLIVFSIVRPFELFEQLRGLPLLYLFCGLAVLGYILDLRTGLSDLRLSKLVRISLVWFGWVVLTAVISAPHTVSKALATLVPVFLVFFLVSSAIQSTRAFHKVVLVVLLCVIWVCLVCLQQAAQPPQCVDMSDLEAVVPSGIECMQHSDCWGAGPSMRCEHVGVFNLSSINQRVKYAGVLNDPNEVAMLASSALPFAIALRQERPTRFRTIALIIMALMVVATVIATGSRGGQLVLATVVLFYSVQRFGMKRMLRLLPVFLVAGAVLMALRGEAREDAEASSLKRLGCMYTGVELLETSPLVGVGYGQFTQYHDQTAHSAYVLAAAELGFPGFFLWGLVGYLGVKSALRTRLLNQNGGMIGNWGLALATTLTGIMTGIFFLSFTYHLVLWLMFGMSGALNTLQPEARRRELMKTSAPELFGVALVLLAMVVAIYKYAAYKLGV